MCKQPEEKKEESIISEVKKSKSEYQIYTRSKSQYLQSLCQNTDYLNLKLDRDKFRRKVTAQDLHIIGSGGYTQREVMQTKEAILGIEELKLSRPEKRKI